VFGAVVGVLFSWVWITYTYPVLVGHVLSLDVFVSTALLCVVASSAVAAIAGTVAVSGVIRRLMVEGVRAE
jgi:hypothetical protein